MSRMRTTLVASLAGFVLCCTCPDTRAAVINFDALDALAAPVGGTTLDTYLAQYGVTVTNHTPGSSVRAEDDRWSYGGGAVTAPSPHNYLLQSGVNNGASFRLTFAATESSVSFTRVGEPSNSLWPQWSAQAFDASNNPVGGSVGEPLQGGTRGPQTFTLSGTGIQSVVFSGNGGGVAAYASIPFDDLVLPNAVPEPAAALAAFLAAGALACRRRSTRRLGNTVLAAATVLLLGLSAAPVRANPSLTGLISFSTDGSGNAAGGEIWNTLGGDFMFNLYATTGGPAGAFVNSGDAAAAPIAIELADGTHTFTIFGEYPVEGDIPHYGLNLFFDEDYANPRISVMAPRNTSVTPPHPAFDANSAPNTLQMDGSTVAGAGTLAFSSGGTTVTLTDFAWSGPSVYQLDRVSAFDSTPSGGLDAVGQFTLTVVTPEPGAAAISLLTAAGVLRRRRRQGSSTASSTAAATNAC